MFLCRSYSILRYDCSVYGHGIKVTSLGRVFVASLMGMVVPDVNYKDKGSFQIRNEDYEGTSWVEGEVHYVCLFES